MRVAGVRAPASIGMDDQQQQKNSIKLAVALGVSVLIWYLLAMLVVLR